MSDLSSNDTLDPLDSTTPNEARDANIVDNTPDDWESIIDFDMKNGKEDVNMGSSQENDTSLANRLQAEEDNLKKDEIGAIEIDQESSTEPDNTEMTHDDINNSMTIEETSTDEILETHHPDSQAPASAVDTHTNTAEHVPVPKHMFQRLCKRAS